MFKWAPFPLIRIAIVFCGGVLLCIYQPGFIELNILMYGVGILLPIYVGLYAARSKFHHLKYVTGAIGFAILFLAGYILVKVRTESFREDHILISPETIIAYEGVIQDHLEEKKNSFKTTVSIHRIKTRSGWSNASGKVNLYISKKSFQDNLIWGDWIIVKGSPIEVSPPSNPHEFDYKRFLTFKNIYHQHFVRAFELIKTGKVEGGFFRASSLARDYFTTIIKRHVKNEKEQAIVLALIIGVTDGIDNEIVNAYSASGAMHVLAVSGLHVGIIYWMLLVLLKPLQKNVGGKWLVAIICLIVLWSYSFITGLSPSVMRAVTMFTFIAVSNPLNLRSNIFNTLAGSALILLLVDPYLIMSVGFQLSYLAVLGIIWIQRPLYLLYEPKNVATDWIWKISCVSISAQATTFSLGLLYFHQFPTYFLFSNLFVIPISFGVLVSGILLIMVNFIEPLANLIGWVLEHLAWILNKSVFTVEALPHSMIGNIYTDVFQSWLILGILTSLVFIFQHRKIHWLYAALCLSLVLAEVRWMHYKDRMESPSFLVYNVSGASAFEFIDHGRSLFIADSSLINDQERVRFHIRPNRLFNLVGHTNSRIISDTVDNSFLLRKGSKSILFIKKMVNSLPDNVSPDIVIIGEDAAWNSPLIIARFSQAQIILDSSWSIGQLRWLKSKIKNYDQIYSVRETGAFITSL